MAKEGEGLIQVPDYYNLHHASSKGRPDPDIGILFHVHYLVFDKEQKISRVGCQLFTLV